MANTSLSPYSDVGPIRNRGVDSGGVPPYPPWPMCIFPKVGLSTSVSFLPILSLSLLVPLATVAVMFTADESSFSNGLGDTVLMAFCYTSVTNDQLPENPNQDPSEDTFKDLSEDASEVPTDERLPVKRQRRYTVVPKASYLPPVPPAPSFTMTNEHSGTPERGQTFHGESAFLLFRNIQAAKDSMIMKSCLQDQKGTYLIVKTDTGKPYIGSSGKGDAILFDRLMRYTQPAYYGPIHPQNGRSKIRNALQKYGLGAFTLYILTLTDDSTKVRPMEQRLLDKFWGMKDDLGFPIYNLRRIADDFTDVVHTEESNTNNSASKRGENHPFFGKTLSPEHAGKIGSTLSKKIFTTDTRKEVLVQVGKQPTVWHSSSKRAVAQTPGLSAPALKSATDKSTEARKPVWVSLGTHERQGIRVMVHNIPLSRFKDQSRTQDRFLNALELASMQLEFLNEQAGSRMAGQKVRQAKHDIAIAKRALNSILNDAESSDPPHR